MDDTTRREESKGEHVYRYLRAIVSWVSATLTVAQHEVFRSKIPIEVYHVHIPKETCHDAASLHALRDEILESVSSDHDKQKRVRKYFEVEEKQFQLRYGDNVCSVHAEAALLGILTNHADKACTPELRSLFSYKGRPLDDFGSLFVVSC